MNNETAAKSDILTETVTSALVASNEVPTDCHPSIARFVEYWGSLRQGDLLPRRGDLDPIEIPELLPSIRLLDIEGDPARFRVRLTGDKVRAHFGTGNVGGYLDEILVDFENRESYANCMTAIAERRPVWHRGVCDLNPDKEFVPLERVMAPLATDGETVDGIIIVSIYGD
tara:strand:+ start:144 stop:656 length:513 start_codon:yes stop_codon:yes gene_type:complete